MVEVRHGLEGHVCGSTNGLPNHCRDQGKFTFMFNLPQTLLYDALGTLALALESYWKVSRMSLYDTEE